jgi:hypothetical protein
MRITDRQRDDLLARAESYAYDATRFAMAAAGEAPSILGPDDGMWAATYRTIAAELRMAAAGQEPRVTGQVGRVLTEVTGNGAVRAAIPERDGDRVHARLAPDLEVVGDGSNCIVLRVPGYRVTVGNVGALMTALGLAVDARDRREQARPAAVESSVDPELTALACEVLAEAPPEGFTAEMVRERSANANWTLAAWLQALRVLEARGAVRRLIAQPGGLRWALRSNPFPMVPPGEVEAEVTAGVHRLTSGEEQPR